MLEAPCSAASKHCSHSLIRRFVASCCVWLQPLGGRLNLSPLCACQCAPTFNCRFSRPLALPPSFYPSRMAHKTPPPRFPPAIRLHAFNVVTIPPLLLLRIPAPARYHRLVPVLPEFVCLHVLADWVIYCVCLKSIKTHMHFQHRFQGLDRHGEHSTPLKRPRDERR